MWDNLQLLFVWAPIINLQVILDGIFVGAVFALSAYGLALVWGVMNIKNLAQGDFVILGGYLAFWLNMYHIPLIVILPIVMIADVYIRLVCVLVGYGEFLIKICLYPCWPPLVYRCCCNR